jgi:hypothetical protein
MTRDSLGLWLAAVAALVGYLVTAGDPPTQWTYQQWLQAVAFVAAWGVGKLQSSPLPGKE